MTNERDKLKGPTHLLLADCPDCGRMIVYNNRCSVCAGEQWLPAGYINRFVILKERKDYAQA